MDWIALPSDTLLREERDCGEPEIISPYVCLALPGYGVEEALLDRPILPIKDQTTMDVFKWIQKIGGIWHDRLFHLSKSGQGTPEWVAENSESSNSSACNGGEPGRFVLAIPPMSLFTDINGIYIPKDCVEALYKVPEDKKVCVVSVQFASNDDEDGFLQLMHITCSTASKLLSGMHKMSLAPSACHIKELIPDFCIPLKDCRGIQNAWTLGLDKLAPFATKKTQWMFLPRDTPTYENTPSQKRKRKNTTTTRKTKTRLTRAPRLSSSLRPYNAYRLGMPLDFFDAKDDAIERAMITGLMVFGYDFYEEAKSKKFLTCSFPTAYRIIFKHDIPNYWREMKLHEVGYKSMYEGMQFQFPQKLILDMEYMKNDNPQWTNYPSDADKMTLDMIEYISSMFHIISKDGWEPDITDWLILEADSDEKVSRHAILNAPGKYFNSMVDACRFRDVVQTAVESGLMVEDPSTLQLMANKPVERNPKTGRLKKTTSSIAAQCFVDGEWKTCFNDWGIINNTFRMMRSYGSTKIGQDRFLKVSKTLNKFDPVASEMGRRLSALVGGDMSMDYLYFMSSMVHAVVPEEGVLKPGWTLTKEKALEHRKEYMDIVKECLKGGKDTSNFAGVMHMLKTGKKLPARSSAEQCHKETTNNNGTIKRDVGSLLEEDSYENKAERGYMSKERVPFGGELYLAIVEALSHLDDLRDVTNNTENWRIDACTIESLGDTPNCKKGPTMYWIIPQSKMCPIGGEHSNAGKTMIRIYRRGKVSAKCFSGRCAGSVWTASQRVGCDDLELLWPT